MAQYSGVSGNTLNLFLRSVGQGKQAVDREKLKVMTTSSGDLSVDALNSVDEVFADAVQNGYNWVVLSCVMRREEPNALQDIQASENILGSIQRLSGQIEMISRICSAVGDHGLFQQLGFEGFRDRLLRQAPHLTDHLSGMMRFALAMGGAGSVHTGWLKELQERFVGGSRKLCGDIFHALAVEIPVYLPRVKRAILFAAFACPNQFIRDGYCEHITKNDILKMKRCEATLALATELEARMEEVQSSHHTKGGHWSHLSRSDFQALFARLECRIAA